MLEKTEREKLQGELTTVHELLENVDEVNTDTKEALQLLAADIQRILQRESERDDWSGIGKRWREAVLDFEVKHPRLAQAIDEVTGLLANAGI